ncbi:hypothetical protein VPH35_069839 [Triticum aestivum]
MDSLLPGFPPSDVPSHRRSRSMGHQNFMSIELQQIEGMTSEFTLQLLDHITNHFSEESIIGRGGSGVVYKGELDNGEEIAMKKLHQMPGLDEKQFTNEFNNLMRAKHKNIIRLVGYCYYLGHERVEHKGKYVFAHVQERLLCYEYLQGGNLDQHLFDELCGLDWHTRYKIIKGVCEGLNFLHTGSEDPICHLDLKPANILLDKDMTPKIADFGLSRLFASAQTHITTQIIGTLGYMPPEFIERGKITPKFDIFSLGVIIIKIIAGPDGYSKFADMSSEEFDKLLHQNWAKRLHETMPSGTLQEMKTCMDIASRCVERDEEKRPCISEIIHELYKIDSGIINEPNQNYSDILDKQDKLDGHLVDEVDKIGGNIAAKIEANIINEQDKKSLERMSRLVVSPRCVWASSALARQGSLLRPASASAACHSPCLSERTASPRCGRSAPTTVSSSTTRSSFATSHACHSRLTTRSTSPAANSLTTSRHTPPRSTSRRNSTTPSSQRASTRLVACGAFGHGSRKRKMPPSLSTLAAGWLWPPAPTLSQSSRTSRA